MAPRPGGLTHASFFSGIGAVDLGLERAGFRTISHSEIDAYASAVLAAHWPDVPNLGDITDLAGRAADEPAGQSALDGAGGADVWSGGFPCQDLSVAGKRAGFEGSRSSLAFAFLDLVGRYRPRAVLLENVPGLLTSHGGRDFGSLLGALVELGYGVAWRELDARFFGVPQRRRRIFILGLRSGADDPDGRLAADRAGEVLAVGTRCGGHPPTGVAKGKGAAAGPRGRADIAQSIRAADGRNGTRGDGTDLVGPSPDAGRDRAPDGSARRVDDCASVAYFLAPESGQGADLTAHPIDLAGGVNANYSKMTDRGIRVATFTKGRRAQSVNDNETWVEGDTSPTLNDFDTGAARATTLIAPTVNSNRTGGWRMDADQVESLVMAGREEEDPLLPVGLDSNRYRCCGNAVVVPVAEWIGHRLAAYLTANP